jgi:hypothetical protein
VSDESKLIIAEFYGRLIPSSTASKAGKGEEVSSSSEHQ